jgi:hypothetical protein
MRQFRQVVNGFAQKEIAPRAAEIDKTNRMPEVGLALDERIDLALIHDWRG